MHDEHPLSACDGLDFAHEPRFSHARLAGNQNDGRQTRFRLVQGGPQQRQLVVAAGEFGTPDHAGYLPTRGGRRSSRATETSPGPTRVALHCTSGPVHDSWHPPSITATRGIDRIRGIRASGPCDAEEGSRLYPHADLAELLTVRVGAEGAHRDTSPGAPPAAIRSHRSR